MYIRNKFHGRCACGRLVQPYEGFVMARRIVCANCGAEALGAAENEQQERSAGYEDPIYGFDDV